MHVRVLIHLHCGKVSIVDGNVLVPKLVWFFNGTWLPRKMDQTVYLDIDL
jgi:hypothetical protein